MEAHSSPFLGSHHKSLKHLYLGLSVVTLVAIGVAAWALIHLRHEAESRVAMTTQNLAVLLEKNIDAMIDTIDVAERSVAYEIGKHISSGKPDAKAISDYLVMQTESLDYVSFLRATNERGDVIYGKVLVSPPSTSSDRDYFLALRDNPIASLFVGKPIMGRIDNKWAWPFSMRINKSDGSFGGVVFASAPIDEIERMFAQMKLGSNSVIALRDANMGIVARKTFDAHNTVPIGDNNLSTPYKEALKKNPDEGTYISDTTNADGFSRWYSYRRNPKYGFTVFVGIPINAVVDEWKSQAAIVVGALTIFIIASLAYFRQARSEWLGQEQNREELAKLNEDLVQRELQVRQLALN